MRYAFTLIATLASYIGLISARTCATCPKNVTVSGQSFKLDSETQFTEAESRFCGYSNSKNGEKREETFCIYKSNGDLDFSGDVDENGANICPDTTTTEEKDSCVKLD